MHLSFLGAEVAQVVESTLMEIEDQFAIQS